MVSATDIHEYGNSDPEFGSGKSFASQDSLDVHICPVLVSCSLW
jgi:hypothetical protein